MQLEAGASAPDLCRWPQTGAKPRALSSADASRTPTKGGLAPVLPESAAGAGWTSREVGEAAGEAAGCGRLVGRLSPLPERGPRSLEAPCARPVPGSPLCARGAREPPISLRIFFALPKS